ncbi:hypothetical protein HPB51_012543 [Rhipicephalus microplus]|uniref:HTH CENPB-type domain-containing protein n=1 Tax=Rhipicephalus microplus TaxID=6941 RepID=A0A9J6DG39_RHIMP|nr:hypothetical protein HPB51_012543 [Rhipicephalus microplus]
MLGIENFASSDGWLTRFKQRHDMVFKSVNGVGEEDTSELDVDGLLPALGDVPFEEYIAADSSVETCGALSGAEIVEMVRPSEPSHETEVDDDDDARVGGNLVAIQSCKLTTLLAQRSKLGSHPSSDAKSCIDPCSAFCGKNSHARTARLLMLMVLPGHLIFVYTIRLLTSGNTVITPMFLACYMTSALIQVALLLYTARCMVYWMWSRRVDPDNAAIPYLTALGDLLGIALLAASFCLLDALGDCGIHSPDYNLPPPPRPSHQSPVTMPFASTGIFD